MAAMDHITVVHTRKCSARDSGRCNCSPSYRVQVWNPRAKKLHRKTFAMLSEAKGWRDDVKVAVRKGTITPATRETVAEAAHALVQGMKDGSVLDRTGKLYKPATIRSYEQALRAYVLPDLGAKTLTDVRRADVQAFVDDMRRRKLAPSTIANKLDPLRVIFRRAVRAEIVAVDPTLNLELPSITGRRDRIAHPAEAAELIQALPQAERALWATALYAGLRRGELRALKWECVDFDAGVIRVEWGWDDVEGRIEVKTDAGRRRIPLVGSLRKLLASHKLATGRTDVDLVFGRTAALPFIPTTIRSRARKAWTAAELKPLTPHEARHCAASYLIAAGLNPKKLSEYIGHSDIRTTYNVYGHLLPGDEAEDAATLDAFFQAAEALRS